ncbi:hypothetical protein BFGS084_01422 [Bacteroides fragilis]|nr:hypothetical protein BFGS084_01422 [Bacteroides fragilis]
MNARLRLTGLRLLFAAGYHLEQAESYAGTCQGQMYQSS